MLGARIPALISTHLFRTTSPPAQVGKWYACIIKLLTIYIVPMYNAMKNIPRIDIPLDGAGGNNGLFWFPTSMDPKTFTRSYARTGHYDNIQRPNFDLITMHKVNKVLFDGTRAVGLQFTPRGTNQTAIRVRANREVIISAGTVHTSQILQRSGIGPKDLLEQAGIPTLLDLPGVGQNFQDHAYLSVGYRCKSHYQNELGDGTNRHWRGERHSPGAEHHSCR